MEADHCADFAPSAKGIDNVMRQDSSQVSQYRSSGNTECLKFKN